MNLDTNNIRNQFSLLLVFYIILYTQITYSQETTTELNSSSTYHNQLFFNRFLINPTFSLVRENKSYLNILHRNQYTAFEDNRQNYFLGFSNRLNDHTAVGIGVYSQWAGVVQEFGFNANYATSVKLGVKSKLTFGANLIYFNEGIDRNRIIINQEDTKISESKKESKLAIQPAITLSMGSFDFGLYAVDLFRYNQTTNDFLTNFNDKSIRASLQYTYSFNANEGLFSSARLMPLVQLRRKQDNSLAYSGSFLLDLPKYGWLQGNYNDTYGMSMGLGFNLSKKMSLGYLLEKDLSHEDADLGWNHEVSLAYTFKNENESIDGFAGYSQDQKIDRIVRNYEEQILKLKADKDKSLATTKSSITDENSSTINNNKDFTAMAYQNRLVLDELILRQDSIENARMIALERRFEIIVRSLRNDIKSNIDKRLQDFDSKPSTSMLTANTIQESKKTAKITRKDFAELPPIKVLNQTDIVGVKSGYYVIANVYKSKKYLNSFMTSLKEQGLDAKKFYNKENGLYYVYLADYNYKLDAKSAYVTDLNGKYEDEKWIMEVANNSTAIVHNTYE